MNESGRDAARLGRPRVWIVVGLVVLLAAAAGAWLWWRGADGSGMELTTQRVGSIEVGVGTVPTSPSVGDNQFVVEVRDSEDRPIRDADIDAVIFMPAMGSMPYMETRPKLVETRPGRYEGKYNLVMGGSWDIDLRLAADNRDTSRAALRLTVGTEGLTWVSEGEMGMEGESQGTALGAVTLSHQRRQEIGVTTAPIERRGLRHARRATGMVEYDETRVHEVNLKYEGWVRSLLVDFTGKPVRRGQTLFTIYSPELFSGQRELISALSTYEQTPEGIGKDRAGELIEASRQRLLLWDMTADQLEELERSRQPQQEIAVLAPISGIVVEKNLLAGSHVQSGQMLYRIAPLDPIWVQVDVFQYELPLLREGQSVRIELPYQGESRQGRITYIYPYLQGETRSGKIRVEVANRDLALKPDMFVDVLIEIDLGDQLAVPQSAVIHSGERRVVFVDRGGGRLEPREVELSGKSGDYFVIESGLEEGDEVVTSGNFLIAAESRLRAATRR